MVRLCGWHTSLLTSAEVVVSKLVLPGSYIQKRNKKIKKTCQNLSQASSETLEFLKGNHCKFLCKFFQYNFLF